MFAVYGTSGQLFVGPFEALRQVAPTLRIAPLRPLEPEHATPAAEQRGLSAWEAAAQGRTPQAHALHAYARMQRPAGERRPLSRVEDVMTRDPWVLSDAWTVWEAWSALAAQGLSQAPVVNAEQRLVGLLTWVQFMRPDRLPNPDGDPGVWRESMARPVRDWMVSPVPSVDPGTDIRRLCLVLLETGLPGLPVVAEAGRVLGYVSRSDILRSLTHDPPLDLWAR